MTTREFKFSEVTCPYDPLLPVMFRDIAQNPLLSRAVRGLRSLVVPHNGTLHPSDDLLEAWYQFKERLTCQP